MPRKLARSIGIAVDPRRQNLSEEGLKLNVERLQEFKKRLILFPRRAGKHTKADAEPEHVKHAKSGGSKDISRALNFAMPIENKIAFEEVKLKDVEGEEGAYRKLRIARSDARYIGVREKRAKAKSAEEANAVKK